MAKATLPQRITRRQASEVLGVSMGTVDNMIRDGRLRAYKLGRHTIRLDRDEVEAALAPMTHHAQPRDKTAQAIADYIEKILTAAPPLTTAQRDRLAELLRPARQIGGAA